MSSPHEIITHLSRTRGIVDKFRIYELTADENVTLKPISASKDAANESQILIDTSLHWVKLQDWKSFDGTGQGCQQCY